MRVALISESSADEPALRILTEAILGEVIEVEQLRVRSRGWQSVFKNLRSYLAALHYGGADGAVILLDSDDTELHDNSHGPDLPRGRCRLCDLRRDAEHILKQFTPVEGRSRLKVATGLACPLIEAWWNWLDHKRITEAGWRVAKQEGRGAEYSRASLKARFYKAARLDIAHQTAAMMDAATRALWPVGRIRALVPGRFRAASS